MGLSSPRIAVVGGGIGGLAAALALRRAGAARVTVHERASALGEVGQGLGVFANGVRALDWLGVGEGARTRGWRMACAGTYDPRGRPLMATDPEAEEARSGVPSLLMTRPDLHGLLLEALPPGIVRPSAELAGLEDGTDGVTLRFADGTAADADLVVGADGWRSAVRRALRGEEPPRYSGLVCWRGMAAGVALDDPHLLPVVQGRGMQVGVGPLGRDRLYWFASLAASARSGPADPAAARALLLDRCRGWPFGIPAILAATDPRAMLRTDLHDRPPLPGDEWVQGRVALLGDAAHPMVPTLGQGAATALEDAVVLARRLAAAPDLADGLRAYAAARAPRTGRIVATAYGLARLAAWTGPLATTLRDLALRATPAALARRAIAGQLGYDAGTA